MNEIGLKANQEQSSKREEDVALNELLERLNKSQSASVVIDLSSNNIPAATSPKNQLQTFSG